MGAVPLHVPADQHVCQGPWMVVSPTADLVALGGAVRNPACALEFNRFELADGHRYLQTGEV